ncbi:DUF3040 domain-containing protein [Streptacidiphilus melanogenes]|uniref:DUF3040 domain-containing protein n=1 Tax=Streptacidiphilus melanogenes TaxID=411235 RepID=UPI0005AA93BF|nr:DUF3040 domain-containing protein [Streptacidiphilus melanogenes]
MLSQQERRTLAAIEERLSGEDPELDRLLATFDRPQEPARCRTRHRAAWWTLFLGLWLLGAAFLFRNADVLVLAFMALLAGAGCWLVVAARAARRRREPWGPASRPESGKQG